MFKAALTKERFWPSHSDFSRPSKTSLSAFRPLFLSMRVATLCVVVAWAAPASAFLSNSFWESIPTGAIIVHPRGDAPPVICSTDNGSHAFNVTAPKCHDRRFLAEAKNFGDEVDKVTAFINKINDHSVSFDQLGNELRELDFRSFNPAVIKAETSKVHDVDSQLNANKNLVTTIVKNLRNLPPLLSQALRVSKLRDIVGTVYQAWQEISSNSPSRCDNYGRILQPRMSELAGLELAFENDDDHSVLNTFVRTMLVAMATLTEMRQMCDAFGAANLSADVGLMYNVLIQAAKIKKESTGTLEKAKSDAASNPSSFNGSQAFMHKMQDLLQAKSDLSEGAADVFKSDAWRVAVSGNSAAADATKQLAAGMLTRHDQFSGKLTGLESDIKTTANQRLEVLGKVDKTIDEFHTKKMDQMNGMSTKFAGQHDQRMGRLTSIDNKVQGITTQAKAGFQQIGGKLDSLQTNLFRVIDGVANVIKDDAALTTSELKDALARSYQQTQAKISSIDGKIDGQAAAVQDTLANTKVILQNNFEETNSVLYGASAQMSTVVSRSFQVIQNPMVEAARQTQDIVSSRIKANGERLSEQLVEFDKKIEYVDGRLIMLADQVATLEDKLAMTNAILADLASSVEVIAVGLEDLIGDIKEIFFQKTFQDLTDRYSSLRSNYKSVLGAPEDSEMMSSLKLSCEQVHANDLFLSYLNLVDIEDEQIPKQLESFQNDPTKYELFGMQVITVLDELSLLTTICSGLLFRDDMTEDDLTRKATENARLIRQAARQFTRHIDEVVPAYMIRQKVREELEKASKQELGGTPDVRAKNLNAIQARLQSNVGAFAHVSVIAAPKGGTLAVKHLEEQYPEVDLSNIRRYGMMVSANKAIAIMWGNTPQLPASETLDKDVLLRQGIYRGTLTSPQGCTVAQDPRFYPRCASCVCDHFEDFASTTTARAGRVVTILNSTSIDSPFTVSAVFDAHVDYFMEQIRLDVSLDSPGLAAIKANVLDKQRAPVQRVMWEGFSENGKFHVIPGDVKGTLLATNELTLTLTYGTAGTTAFRRVVPLFCNGRPQEVQYDTTATLTYQCREKIRKSLGDGTEAIVSRGVSPNRLETAVCVEGPDDAAAGSTKMDCRVTGGFDAVEQQVSALRIGRYVRDVTLYAGLKRSGDFAVCKACDGAELLKTVPAIKSIALESPDEQLLPYMATKCEKLNDEILTCTR